MFKHLRAGAHDESSKDTTSSSAELEQKGESQTIGKSQQQSFSERAIYFAMLVCDMDLFSIYKGNYRDNMKAKYRIYQSSMLSLKPNSEDKLRDKLRRPMQILFCYLTAKFSIICATQIVLYWLNKRRSILNLSTDESNEQLKEIITSNEASIEGFSKIRDMFGNIFANDYELTIMLLLVTITFNLYGIMMIPQRYKTKPIDVANLRFLLDPQREIKRLDMMIEERIDEILFETANNKLVKTLFKQISSLRPSTFNSQWYRLSHWIISILLLVGIAAEILHWALLYYIIYRSMRDRCKTDSASDRCQLKTIVTWQEAIVLVDITLGQIQANVLWFLLLFFMWINLICQLSLVLSIKRCLAGCLRIMLSENASCHRELQESPGDLVGSISDPGIMTLVPSLPRVEKTSSSLLNSKGREDKIIRMLLQTLIKLEVTVDEIRRTAGFLQDCAESLMFIIIFVAIPTSMLINRNNMVSLAAQLPSIILGYLATNILLAFTAFVYFLMCKQEKLAWSLLAELSIYRKNHKQMQQEEANCVLFDLIKTKWLRFVHNHNLSDTRNTVSVYGFSVKYSSVLTINFAILTFMYLLTSIEVKIDR